MSATFRQVLWIGALAGLVVLTGSTGHAEAAVRDPALVYSTYLGGSEGDWAYAIAVDPAGNAYVAGSTSSLDFPHTGSPAPPEGSAFVSKLDPRGNLVYTTFIPGAGLDGGNLIQADAAGNVYLAGVSQSPDFPLVNPLPPSYRLGNTDAFVLKLDPRGSLVYSTRLGGSGADAARSLAVDPRGNIYVGGGTTSQDFPLKNPLFSSGSGFVTKLSPDGSALVYSTRFPAGGPIGLAVDPQGQAVFAGMAGPDLPVWNALQAAPPGSTDTYVAKLTRSGSALVYSTYLGGSSEDEIADIALDPAGNAYVTGVTISPDFPLRNAFQTEIPQHPTVGGLYHDTFVTKLDRTGALIYSTFLGGIGYDWSYAIAVDPKGSAYVTGYTESPDYPLKDPLDADCGLLPAFNLCFSDAFVAKLSPAGNQLLFSTYLGGSSAPAGFPANDFGFGIAIGPAGTIYIAGGSFSVDFPVAAAFQPVHGSATSPPSGFDSDGFVAKIRLKHPK